MEVLDRPIAPKNYGKLQKTMSTLIECRNVNDKKVSHIAVIAKSIYTENN